MSQIIDLEEKLIEDSELNVNPLTENEFKETLSEVIQSQFDNPNIDSNLHTNRQESDSSELKNEEITEIENLQNNNQNQQIDEPLIESVDNQKFDISDLNEINLETKEIDYNSNEELIINNSSISENIISVENDDNIKNIEEIQFISSDLNVIVDSQNSESIVKETNSDFENDNYHKLDSNEQDSQLETKVEEAENIEFKEIINENNEPDLENIEVSHLNSNSDEIKSSLEKIDPQIFYPSKEILNNLKIESEKNIQLIESLEKYVGKEFNDAKNEIIQLREEIVKLSFSTDERNVKLEDSFTIIKSQQDLLNEYNELRNKIENLFIETKDQFEKEFIDTKNHIENKFIETRKQVENESIESRKQVENEFNDAKNEMIQLRDEIVKLTFKSDEKNEKIENSLSIIKSQQELIQNLNSNKNQLESNIKKEMQFYFKNKRKFSEVIEFKERSMISLRSRIILLENKIKLYEDRINSLEEALNTTQQSLDQKENNNTQYLNIIQQKTEENFKLSLEISELKNDKITSKLLSEQLESTRTDKLNLDTKFKELSQIQDTLVSEKKDLKSKLTEAELEINGWKLKIDSLQLQISKLQSTNNYLVKSTQEKETKISEYQDRVKKAEDIINEYVLRLLLEEDKNSKHEFNIENLLNEIDQLKKIISNQEEKINDLDYRCNKMASELETEKQERFNEKNNYESTISDLSNKLLSANNLIEEWKHNAEKAQEFVIKSKNDQIYELKEHLQLMEKQYLGQGNTETTLLREKNHELQSTLDLKENELRRVKEELTNLQIQYINQQGTSEILTGDAKNKKIIEDILKQVRLELEIVQSKNEKLIQSHEKEKNRLLEKISTLEQSLEFKKETDYKFLYSNQNNLENEIQSNRESEFLSKYTQLEQRFEQLNNTYLFQQNEIQRLQEQLSSVSSSDPTNTSLISFLEQSKELNLIQIECSNLRKINQDLNQKIDSLKSNVNEKNSELQEEKLRKDIEIGTLQKQNSLLKNAIESRDIMIEQQKQRLLQQKSSISESESLTSKIETLESIIKSQKEKYLNQKHLLKKTQLHLATQKKDFEKERTQFVLQLEHIHKEMLLVAREGANETQKLTERIKLDEVKYKSTIEKLQSKVDVLSSSLNEIKNERDTYQEQIIHLQFNLKTIKAKLQDQSASNSFKLKASSSNSSDLNSGLSPISKVDTRNASLDGSFNNSNIISSIEMKISKNLQRQLNELINQRKEHEQNVIENQFYIASIRHKMKERYNKLSIKEDQLNQLQNSLRKKMHQIDV